MDYDEVLTQVIALLQREKRLSYRVLKRRFGLDDDFIEDLKEDLIYAKKWASDEEGKVLVWIGEDQAPPASTSTAPERAHASPPQEMHPPQAESPPSTSRIPDAERRQLTVLFCDLVDSTRLASQLDPEDLREVIRAYQAACAAVIQRYEGHIAQYLGDGLLVYFGYPRAHEDDAQRAVRTGLGVVEAIQALSTHLEQEKGIRLAVRVGMHTGLVVVGEIGDERRQEQLALGETPNVAARIQGLAAPDTVVLSEATYRLVHGYVVTEDRGSHALKGVATAQQVYRVLQESGVQSRLEIASPRGLTPLVGRASELTLLVDRWEQVKKGRGQVVLLSGEAGIGKSRLVKALKDHLADESSSQSEVRCSPYHQQSAWYPIIDLLQRALGFQRNETSEEKLQKLEAMLSQYDLSLPEMVPLFAGLLLIPLPDRYPPLNLSPQRQRQKTLEALLALRLAIAAQQPVLYIVEDLHWADPSTLDWLGLLLEQIPTSRILVLLTCRPEFHSPWNLHLLQIPLSRFDHDHVEMMVSRITRGKDLPPEVLQQIVVKTDGVPLFVEELTKMVLESPLLREREGQYALTEPVPAFAIPTTLQDSLMARLDRLHTAKGICQLGATLGRQFSYEVLQALAPVDDSTLQRALRRLVDAELLYQRGVPPQATYLFKHALIQEAAYQSLLKSTRQQYHQQIAQVLEAQFPETIETQPELVAHHYTEAGCHDQAVGYWLRAGQQAVQRSANVEAISHLRKGLEVLQTLPDTSERAQQELTLLLTLSVALIATKGPGSLEEAETFTRAWALCQCVEDSTQRFLVLRGLWYGYFQKAELQTAYARGEQLVALAHHHQDAALLVEAYRVMGSTLFFRGEFLPAQSSCEQGIALYDDQHHRTLAFRSGADPGVVCRFFSAWSLWVLGYPAHALHRMHEAVHLAHAVSHPFSLAFTLNIAAVIHHLRREPEQTQARAEAAMTLATEQGMAQWLAYGRIERGWAFVAQGRVEEGLAQMWEGVTAWQGIGVNLGVPYQLSLLAEAYGNMEQMEEGLRLVAEALALVEEHDERWWEAELHRLRGELLLQQSTAVGALLAAPMVGRACPAPTEEAEICFHHALTISRRQQAKSFELRAAMSLSRLWQQQDKRQEARELLAPIYGWFTEGFDTADLQEAQALLEELT